MNLKALFELLKEYPGRTASVVVTVVIATWAIGGWVWDADDCHAQTKENEKTIVELVEIQRAVAREREADAIIAKQVMEERKRLCTAKILTDKALCATVGVAVE